MFRYLMEGSKSYKEHIANSKKLFKNGQKQNQFLVKIEMIKPIHKMQIVSEVFKSISVTFGGLQSEPIQIGSANINTFTNQSSYKIDFVAHEIYEALISSSVVDKDLYEYFFMQNGKDIIPKDGTFLLAKDWYFNIEVYALENSTRILELDRKGISKTPLTKKPIISGEFIIENPTKLDWNTQSNGENQEFIISFVPINSAFIKNFKEVGNIERGQ